MQAFALRSLVEILLKADEGVADGGHAAEPVGGIVDRMVLELEQRPELVLVELLDSLAHILREHEIEKRLKLRVVAREDRRLPRLNALRSRYRSKRESDISEHVEDIAPFGIHHP